MTINPVSERTTQQKHVFLFLNEKLLKDFNDDGLLTGMILIDLKKTFDTVN